MRGLLLGLGLGLGFCNGPTDASAPAWDPLDAEPTAFWMGPRYDDSSLDGAIWKASAGDDIAASGTNLAIATNGAPRFIPGTTEGNLVDSESDVDALIGQGEHRVVIVADLLGIAADTETVYTNAAFYADANGNTGTSVYRTGAGPYQYFAEYYLFDSAYRKATIEITSEVDVDGAGTLVIQTRLLDGLLGIKVNGLAWVDGDACAEMDHGLGALSVGRSYGAVFVNGTIRALGFYDAPLDDEFTTSFVTWASSVPSGWARTQRGTMPTMPDEWIPRDGAQLVYTSTGRVLMLGGWHTDPPVWPPGDPVDFVTNEVWKSDDQGATWSLLLAHDTAPPTSGAGARFLPAHIGNFGAAVLGTSIYTIGCDSDVSRAGDVWRSTDDGATWERICTTAPSFGINQFMFAAYGGYLWLLGGQDDPASPLTASSRVWRSADGITWTQLADAPWSGRTAGYALAHAGYLYVIGGGPYDSEDAPTILGTNDVWRTSDGTSWTEVLAGGHMQWQRSIWHTCASLRGRLWLFNGYSYEAPVANIARAIYSDDDGVTWSAFYGGQGGPTSHADCVVSTPTRVLRVSGDLDSRTVHGFEEL